MQMFAPNVMVSGAEIFGIDDAKGNPNPPAQALKYENEIMTLRSQIKAQPFGAAWLEIVGNNPQPIMIVPTTSTNDAVAQTFPNTPDHPNRMADAQARGFDATSTGKGTPIRLKFNPAALVGGFGGVSGAALLMHEMTHAYRSACGNSAPVPMSGLVNPVRLRANAEIVARFPNWEEWFAIVVENVFSAEDGKSIVRTNWDILHPSFATSPEYFKFWGIGNFDKQTDSQQFADDYRPAIARMRQVEGSIYAAIRSSRAWFNPVRDYIDLLFSTRD